MVQSLAECAKNDNGRLEGGQYSVRAAASFRSVVASCLAVTRSAVCRCWIGRVVCDRFKIDCWRLFVTTCRHVL